MGLAGTALVHGLAVLMLVFAGRQTMSRSVLPAYRVELVAAPRSGGADGSQPTQPTADSPRPTAPAAPPTRRPAAPAPKPVRRPVPSAVSRQPSAVSRQPSAAAAPPSAVSREPSAASPNTAAAPGIGADAATIRTEGVEFPFPGYLRNLVSQVYRRWRPPGGNTDLEAEMIFFVHRDGSVTGLQFVKRSGSFAFDLEAQGAVEATARAGVFGALPAGYGPDLLPVSFFFSPRSLR
jgi:outer membrane biosynthesis protein TonB